MIGLEIGSYKLVSKIGEGGMGEVWLAQHNLLGRKAAVKLLLEEFNQDETVVKRFINEARATSQIQHPGIVQIFDFGKTSSGNTYMIMELLEGETLLQRGRKVGRLPIAQAVSIARQMAEALSVAHNLKVVHRDLKPENVFLVPDVSAPGGERVKILDFGIAKMLDPAVSGAHTRTGSVLGTPVYMSPEQCMAAPGIDHRADLYSLGCVFFQLLCGRPPFDVSGIGELLGAHIYTMPPVPSTINAVVTPTLDAIVLKCLAKKPEDRYPSMIEFIAALDGAPVVSAEAQARGDQISIPVAVLPERSGPEAATIAGSGLARTPTPQPLMVAAVPVKTTILPPEATPIPVAPRPVEPAPKKEITTLGGSTGEQSRRPVIPQPERKKSNSLVAMAVAFGLTVAIALGAFFLFGKGDPPPEPATVTTPPNPVQVPPPVADIDAGG